MKITLNILKYVALISIALILILYILSLIFEREISGVFIKELNKNLNTTVQTGKLDFSLLRRFPRASIELQDILIKSPDPQAKNTSYNYPDTLLYAGKMVLALKITELMHKNYIIDRIDIDHGKINLCKGESGKLNASIWKETTSTDTSAMSLSINNVNINNSSFSYSNPGTGFLISGTINNSANKLTIADRHTDLKSKSWLILSGLTISSKNQISEPYTIRLNTGMRITKDSIVIDRSVIDINDARFEGDCTIETVVHELDIRLETQNTSITSVAEILPDGVKSFINNNDITGQLSGTIHVSGKYDKGSPVLITASMDINQARMKIPSRDIYLDNIITTADLNMDLNNSNKSFVFQTEKFIAQISDTRIAGSFIIRNFINTSIRNSFYCNSH